MSENPKTPKNSDAVTTVEALRCFFGVDRELSLAELKALSKDDRAELAELICAEMGWTLA